MMLERSQGSGESSEKAYGRTDVVILGGQRSNNLLLFSDALFGLRNLAVSLRKLGTSIQHAESTQTDRKEATPKFKRGHRGLKGASTQHHPRQIWASAVLSKTIVGRMLASYRRYQRGTSLGTIAWLDRTTSRKMLRIAEDYEELAKRAEQRIRDKR